MTLMSDYILLLSFVFSLAAIIFLFLKAISLI